MNFSRNLALWVIIALLIFALFNLFQSSNQHMDQSSVPFSDFIESVEKKDVQDVTIQDNTITGTYRDGRKFHSYAPNDPNLISTLREQGVKITAVPKDDSVSLFSILISWFPMLLLIGVWIFFMRQMQGGGGKAMGFGKSKARHC